MNNPWINIPISEYDGHMNHPDVQQQEFLADFFEKSIADTGAESVLLAGCATGNGIDRLPLFPQVKLTAVNINEVFCDHVADRFSDIENLTVRTCSIEEPLEGRFDLIVAGLVLEYVSVPLALANFHSALNRSGVLAIATQQMSSTLSIITPTPYATIRTLSRILHHVDDSLLMKLTAGLGFHLIKENNITLPSGKVFGLFHFQKE